MYARGPLVMQLVVSGHVVRNNYITNLFPQLKTNDILIETFSPHHFQTLWLDQVWVRFCPIQIT